MTTPLSVRLLAATTTALLLAAGAPTTAFANPTAFRNPTGTTGGHAGLSSGATWISTGTAGELIDTPGLHAGTAQRLANAPGLLTGAGQELASTAGLLPGTAREPAGASGRAAAKTGAAAADTYRDVVLVGNSADGTVSVLDGRTFAPLATVDVAADRAQRLAAMNLIERAGYEVVRSQKGGEYFVDDVAIGPDGRTLYVSRSMLADLVAYDLATGAQKWRFKVDGFHADHMALSPDGSRLVISATTAQLAHVVDAATGKQIGTFATGTYPHENMFLAGGTRIYNASIGMTALPRALELLKGPRQLTVVDAATLKTVRTYRFDHGIRPAVILQDESLMYAQLSYLNGFVEYDLAKGRILRTVELPFSGPGAGLSPDDYPQNSAHHGLALSGDGKKLCSAGTIDDYVAIISRPQLTVDRLVPSASLPYWATTSVDGKYCLVSTSNADSLAVISYDTAREVARVPVGDFPQRVRLARIKADVLASLS